MKPVYKLIALISFSNSAFANTDQVTYKCHVEYVGGGDGIHYIEVKSKKAFSIPSVLKQHKVTSPTNGDSLWVLDVSECVRKNQKFASSRAQKLDIGLPR